MATLTRSAPPRAARSEFITLGVRESEDLRAVIAHLRAGGRVTKIGLWGRSMGAATSLFYGQKDPSIAALVLDSPFSKLTDLMQELVDTFGAEKGLHVPRPLVRGAVALMRFSIKRRARFDIADLDVAAAAAGSFVPALFGHATGESGSAKLRCGLKRKRSGADAVRSCRGQVHSAGAHRGAIRRVPGAALQ
jgi:pimeloyl-ACP methyl ester carboxylesterase